MDRNPDRADKTDPCGFFCLIRFIVFNSVSIKNLQYEKRNKNFIVLC